MKAHYVRVWLVVIIIVTIAVLATGCGSMYMVEKTTTIHYNKDSTKTITIVEKKKPVKKYVSYNYHNSGYYYPNVNVVQSGVRFYPSYNYGYYNYRYYP